MKLGIHAPPNGWSQRAIETAAALQSQAFVWLANNLNGPERPQDALRYPDAVHFLRLSTPKIGEMPGDYAVRVREVVTAWRSAQIPNLYVLLGNEPDYADGYDVQVAWPQDRWTVSVAGYASAMRQMFPGITLACPAFTVANTSWLTKGMAATFDVLTCHCYFPADAPNLADDPAWGAAWQYAVAVAGAKAVWITEANTNPTNTDHLSAWLTALPTTITGVVLFIADGASSGFPQYDLTPAQATTIRAALNAPPPIPVPPPTSGYSGTTDPHGGPSNAATQWIAHISATNPVDAQSIVNNYQHYAPMVNYSADLAMAQASLETGGFTSPAWRSRRNPAGIGITGDNVAGPNFPTNTDGIQAHLALLNCYFGDGSDPWGVLSSFGFGGFTKGFTRLNQMNGVWAVPGTTYGEEIAAIANDVTGGVIPQPQPSTGVTLADILTVARDHIGKTLTDEGNAEFGMCEQEFEEWCQEAGLPRVRYASAAADGDVLLERGVLQTTMPPPPGAGVIWSRAFDPEGHICDADEYPYVITTYPGTVSRIDAVANGWYGSPGFLGWFVPEGATIGGISDSWETAPMVGDGFSPDEQKRAWYGMSKPTKAVLAKYPYNPTFGIPQAYGRLMNGTFGSDAGDMQDLRGKSICLGPAVSGEEADPGTPGRSIVYFTAGKLTALRQADGSYKFQVN